LSTNKLKAHETVFISNACKRAIKLSYADLVEMKKAYLEAKTYWADSGSSEKMHWYWKGSADTIESIVNTGSRHMFDELKKMGLDKKMLYIMYGAQQYAEYYDKVVQGLETPLEFKSYREKKLEGDDE